MIGRDPESRRTFILDHTRLQSPPHTPELRLHLADEITPIWRMTEEALHEIGLPPPFWAFAWAGGQALARYILDAPGTVAGLRVVDFASGSGIVAIAAARSGARQVLAADIDGFCGAALALNLEANGVSADFTDQDLLDLPPPEADVILAGDICYEKPLAERVMAWLDARCPEDAGACLIHGDFRFDNVVLDVHPPHPVRGVLDWEMATVGCPLMDWGASLAYWVEAEDDLVMHMMRRQPTHLPGMLRRAEVWALVAERRGQPIPDTDFYEVYGLFRLATILQQIWLRFTLGQTQNPAFAAFGDIAVYLESRCHTILDRRGEG
jgi:predicted nicotinamide N-methyase